MIGSETSRNFQFSDRIFVTLSNVLHGDFTTFVVVARAFHLSPPPNPPPGWTRETGYLGFQETCRIVREFLDAKLKHDSSAIERLTKEISQTSGATINHEPALPNIVLFP